MFIVFWVFSQIIRIISFYPQCLVLFVTHVFFTKRFQSLVFFGFDYVYRDAYTDTNMKRTHDQSVYSLQMNAFIVTLGVVVSTMCFAIYPLYLIIFERMRPIIVPLILPFTNPQESFVDFLINCAHQLIICSLGIFANIGNDIISCFLLNNIDIATRTISCNLQAYGQLLESRDLRQNVRGIQMKLSLREILRKTQDMNK